VSPADAVISTVGALILALSVKSASSYPLPE
jgi:hypothetical protein